MSIFVRMRNGIIHVIDEFIAWVKFGIMMFIVGYVIFCFIVMFGPPIIEIIKAVFS